MEKAGGTTMSAGVTMPVNNITNISEAPSFGGKNVRSEATNPETSQRVSTPETRIEEHSQVVEGETIEEKSNVVNFADHIAKKAKEAGVDEAFEELAKDDKKPVATEDTEKNIERPSENTEQIERPDPMSVQVEMLKQKVEILTEQNSELKARVEKVERVSTQAALSAYELALILQKLIEEAEADERKKENLLAMLAKLMATLLTMILVDEKDQEGKNNNSVTQKAA